MKNYKDMDYEELHEVYMEMAEAIVHVMFMMDLKKKIEAGRKASAEIHTEALMKRCRECND